MRFCTSGLVWLGLQVIWSVNGLTSCAPPSKAFTIKSAQDVSDISKCVTFTGNVVVASGGPRNIRLDGIKSISGDIDVKSVSGLQSLTSTSLQTVTSFTLNDLPQLSELSFPALKNFSSLIWSNLPSLQDCTMASGSIDGEIQHITLYNTSLTTLDWLTWPIGSELNISSNANITSFKISYDSINANSGLTITSNPALRTVDVSSLTAIYGGLGISGNNVSTLTFSKLETIGGYVRLDGAYSNVSMPDLNQINGALDIESTADISSFCSSLEKKKLTAHYDCKSNSRNETASSASGPGSGTTPAASESPKASGQGSLENSEGRGDNQKIGITVGVIGIFLALAIAAFFYIRRRSRSKVREIERKAPSNKSNELDSIELTESRSSDMSFPKELETPTVRLEIAGGRVVEALPAELAATHGRSELAMAAHSPAASMASVNSVTPLVRHEMAA